MQQHLHQALGLILVFHLISLRVFSFKMKSYSFHFSYAYILTILISLANICCSQQMLNPEVEPHHNVSKRKPKIKIKGRTIQKICSNAGKFVKVSEFSRFLYDSEEVPVLHKDAAKICQAEGLELAEINSQADLMGLSELLTIPSYSIQSAKWIISMQNSNNIYTKNDGKTATSFQAFSPKPLQGIKNPEDKCVVLRMHMENDQKTDFFIMDTVPCDVPYLTLCQYPRKTYCYTTSIEAASEEKVGLHFLAESQKGVFHISTQQKTWADGKAYCEKRRKSFGVQPGSYNDAVREGMAKWKLQRGIYWPVGIWAFSLKKGNGCHTFMMKDGGVNITNVDCNIPQYFFCHEDFRDNSKCNGNQEGGLKVSTWRPYTKWVHIPHKPKGNWKEAKAYCEKYGFELPELTSQEDYLSLVWLLNKHDFIHDKIAFGANSKNKDGVYVESDGKTPIRFQTFGMEYPTFINKRFKPLGCTAIKYESFNTNGIPLVYQMDYDCDQQDLTYMCQFKKDDKKSSCNLQSQESLIASDVTLEVLYRSPSKWIFVSRVQKTWDEARKTCNAEGMDLMEYENPGMTKSVQQFNKNWIFWAIQNGIPHIAKFWTSGRFQKKFSKDYTGFVWEDTGKNFSGEYELQKVVISPTDFSIKKMLELCLTISQEKGINKEMLNEEKEFLVQSPKFMFASCNIPHFFFCYKEARAEDPEQARQQNEQNKKKLRKDSRTLGRKSIRPIDRGVQKFNNDTKSCEPSPQSIFTKISSSSKFLWNENPPTTRAVLASQCEEYGYEIAEIRSSADVISISDFLNSHKVKSSADSWMIGAEDIDDGIFYEADKRTRIKFQNFQMEDTSPKGKSCVVLTHYKDANQYFMNRWDESKCNSTVLNGLCQFPKWSHCYHRSSESARIDFDNLTYFGHTETRWLYIGETQKTWYQAFKACKDADMKMLDFEEDLGPGFLGYVNKWMKDTEMKWPLSIWTSGLIDEADKDKGIVLWTSVRKKIGKNKFWNWAPKQPAVTKGMSRASCVCGFTNAKSPMVARVESCEYPKFFMCYKEIPPSALPDKCKVAGPIVRGNLHSKFLHTKTQQKGNYTFAKEICEKWGYEIAEIYSLADAMSAQQYIIETFGSGKEVYLGSNNLNNEETFYNRDRITPISYQAFGNDYPVWSSDEKCISTKFTTEYGKSELYMTNVNCTKTLDILCQLKNSSACGANTKENVAHVLERLNLLYEEGPRRLHISTMQKTWLEARKYCKEHNMELYKLTKYKQLNQLTFEELSKYVEIHTGLSNMTKFWTSGRIRKDSNGIKYIAWDGYAETFPLDEKSIAWDWNTKIPTTFDFQSCIALGTQFIGHKVKGLERMAVKRTSCETPHFFICSEESSYLQNCDVPPAKKNTFFKAGINSKYLLFDKIEQLTHSQIHEICQFWDFEMAEISSVEDYLQLINAFNSWGYEKESFILGMECDQNSGIFKQNDGMTPIQFQIFPRGEPEFGHCYVSFEKHNSTWMMRSTKDPKGFTMCMYKKSSKCHSQSNEGRKKKKQGELELLGATLNREYYIGTQQKTWSEAMRSCWSYKKNLVDLTMNTDENREFYNFLYEWTSDQASELSFNQANLIPKFDNSFWTSGKFVESYKDKQFRWETHSTFFNIEEEGKKISWRWAPNEPMDPTDKDLKMERCLSIGLTNLDKEKEATTAIMSVDHCLLPKYYVCYKDISGKVTEGTSESNEIPGIDEFLKDRPYIQVEEPIIDYTPKPPCVGRPEIVTRWLRLIRPPSFMICDERVPSTGVGDSPLTDENTI